MKKVLMALVAAGMAAAGAAGATLTGETSEPRSSMFVEGEDVWLYFTAAGLKYREKDVSIDLEVKDENDKTLHRKKLHVEVNDAGVGTSSYLISWHLRKLGFYRVHATLSDGTKLPAVGSREAGYLTYAVMRDPKKKKAYTMPYTHFMTEGGGWRGFMSRGWRQHQSGGQWRHLEEKGFGSYAKNPEAGKVVLRRSLKTEGPVKEGELRNDYGLANLLPGISRNWPRTEEYWTKASLKSRRVPMLTGKGLEAWREYCGALAKNWARQFADHPRRLYQVLWEQDPVHGESTWEDFKEIYRAAYEEIHRADPKACVLLMPNDIAENLRNGMGQYADGISNHSYCGFPVEANGLVERCRRTHRTIRELAGKEMPVYGTEFGYSTAGLKANERLQLYGMVRGALIMLGEGWKSNSLFKGADYRAEPGYGINYNLDYGARNNDWAPGKTSPKPAMPALDAMINMVEGHLSMGAVEFLGETVLGYVLKAEDGHEVAVLWDWGEGGAVEFETGREEIEVADMMGNLRKVKTAGGKVKLELTEAPQYVIGLKEGVWTAERLRELNAAAAAKRERANRKRVAHKGLRAALKDGRPAIEFELEEQEGEAVEGVVRARIRGNPDGRGSAEFKLPASGTRTVQIGLPELETNPLESVEVELTIEAGGKTHDAKEEINFLFAKRLEGVKFDGRDDEWGGVEEWPLDAKNATRAPQWHSGPEDVDASVRVAWNDEELLFFVKTTDDTFLQKETGWKTWDWDCLQMGFTKVYRHRDTNNQWLDALTRCRTELDFALTEKGPETFRAMTWDKTGHPVALLDPAKARLGIVQRKRGDGKVETHYEIGLKWEVLGVAKADGRMRMGWSLAVLDQDHEDRTVQRYPSQIGAFSLKNPMKFGMIVMVE